MNKTIVGTLPAIILNTTKRSIFKKLYRGLDEYGFIDKRLNDNLIKLIPKGEGIIIGSVGSSSFYYNPERVDNKDKKELIDEFKKMNLNPDNPNTLSEYIYHSLLYNKKLIMISLLESATPVLAHEMGHMFEDLRGGWTKFLQGNRIVNKVSRSDKLKSVSSFCLALFGQTISSYLVPIILSSPTLVTEFMASKIGYDLLKEAGANQEQLNSSIKCLASAWGTYLLGSTVTSLNSQIKGSLLRYVGSLVIK